jgi:drug/metabolite transporter (DMT)-like permease
MRPEYFLIALTALCWGGYPLVTRSAGFEGPRATLVLMLAGLVPIAVTAFFMPGAGVPTKLALTKLCVAGIVMGVGMMAFHALTNSKMEASISIPMVDVAMLLVSAIGAVLLFGEPVTMQKLGGIVLLLLGIALLRPA